MNPTSWRTPNDRNFCPSFPPGKQTGGAVATA